MIEACSIPRQNMSLAIPIGIDGSEPVGEMEENWGKKPKDYSELGNQATLGAGK